MSSRLGGSGAALLLCLTAPWMMPPSAGPSPIIIPWLLSAACAALLLGLAGSIGVKWESWLKAALAAWMVAGALNAVIGLCQYFGWADGLAFMSAADLGEAYGNLRQRNQLATLTSIGMLATLAWRATASSAPGAAPSYGQLTVGALLATACAATSSRTGFVQWALIVLLTACWPSSQRRTQLIFATRCALVYIASLIALPWLLTATTGVESTGLLERVTDSAGCNSRLVLWSNVLSLISQKPWLGWGWGNLDYAHYAAFYEGTRFCDILDNAHNLPLQLAVELGVPFALLATGIAGYLVWRSRPWRETDPIRQAAWGVLAVIFIHSMLEYPLWYGPFQIAVAVCLVILVGPCPVLSSAFARRSQALAAAATLSALAYAGWDYHRISQIYLSPAQRSAHYRDDTLAKVQGSWLYKDQVRFAELTLTPLSRANAEWTFSTAIALLRYSPEPRVIEKVIESATLLNREDEALAHLARYRAAFPADYARWSRSKGTAPVDPSSLRN